MKFCKILSTSLSIVGAVVIMDRLADFVSTAHKKQIGKCLSNLDIDINGNLNYNADDCCNGTVEVKKSAERKYSLGKIFPDIKKYMNPHAENENDNFTFQYSIKVKSGEDSMYNEMNSQTATTEHGDEDIHYADLDEIESEDDITADIPGDTSLGNI